MIALHMRWMYRKCLARTALAMLLSKWARFSTALEQSV